LSVPFDPRVDRLGLTVNLADGLILAVDPYCSLVSQLDGLCLRSRIIGLNDQTYSAPLFNHLRNMGHAFRITFAVTANNPITNPIVGFAPSPQNAPNVLPRNVPDQRQTLNVPAQPRPAQQTSSNRRSAGSSSGSPHQQRFQSHSRTPERSAPRHAPVVPNLDMALKITTCFPVTVEVLKQKFNFACVYPKEIKLVNQFCAYAVFDSTFSLRLAVRSDLGQGVQVKLARESRV